jgi:hypothetical protein
MDAVKDERGQALIMSVLLIAIGAVAISGLRIAQEQILAAAQERRAGEAAVEAATAVIADVYTAELRRMPPPIASLDVLRAITDPRARDAARAAATDISLLNGGPPFGDPTVRCAGGLVDVSVTLSGRQYRAGFSGPLCSPR